MLRSLRFRVPALFLAGIAVAGIVSAAIAIELVQSYSRDQTVRRLRREASGLAELFANQSGHETLSAKGLESATADRIFYVPVAPGITLFPGQQTDLRVLPRSSVDWSALHAGRTIIFEFTPPAERHRFLAVGRPVLIGDRTFGALVVAAPKSSLATPWGALVGRLALAFCGGLIVAGGLAWYLSRRLARPVLALSTAADEIAEGNYAVSIPAVKGGGEIDHLAERFRGMAERLSEAEQLERNFLMTVSHELRTPLTAIRGHVSALLEGIAEDPEARAQSLEVIAAETGRLERLVGDVLDLAKLDTRRFTLLQEEVDMGRLLDRAYATFGEEARRRSIDYRREISARPVILSDGDRVLQIISNLLANAFRWTPDGGRIDLALAADNGSVSVAVADNGPGIESDERERIFRPFWTRDGSGTGLGLAIARELASALGGTIELETGPGRGSRFELRLPAGGA